MPGQGLAKQSTPVAAVLLSRTPLVASITAGSTPKNGKVADPAFVGVAPGSGVITIPPAMMTSPQL